MEDADLTDVEAAEQLMTLGAPALAAAATALVAGSVADFDPAESCPRIEADVDADGFGTTTVEGGCETGRGDRFEGSITLEVSKDATSARFHDFRSYVSVACDGGTVDEYSRVDGKIDVDPESFSLDLLVIDTVLDGCEVGEDVFAIEYDGAMSEVGERTTWSGRGKFGMSEVGKVAAETVDEVTDATVCEYEALSGSMALTAAGDELIVTYDGESDCDESSTVKVSVNGEPRGEVEGVACNNSTGSPAGLGIAAFLGLVALVLRWRWV